MSQDLAIDFDRFRRTELRRAVAISAAAHLALLGVFLYSPDPPIAIRAPRGVIAVELVAMPQRSSPIPPSTTAPTARPAPRPKPKTVVLPAEPTAPKPKPKPKSKPMTAAKPKPKAKPTPTQPVVPPPPQQQELDDVLAQLRAESGESPNPIVVASAETATGPAGIPTGVPISAEVAMWLKRAKIHVRRNWVLQPGFKTQALAAEVRVDLSPTGAVRGVPKITRKSGNPWYDEGVVRAIQKSSPLPAPPEAGKWTFVFMPEDSY